MRKTAFQAGICVTLFNIVFFLNVEIDESDEGLGSDNDKAYVFSVTTLILIVLLYLTYSYRQLALLILPLIQLQMMSLLCISGTAESATEAMGKNWLEILSFATLLPLLHINIFFSAGVTLIRLITSVIYISINTRAESSIEKPIVTMIMLFFKEILVFCLQVFYEKSASKFFN